MKLFLFFLFFLSLVDSADFQTKFKNDELY